MFNIVCNVRYSKRQRDLCHFSPYKTRVGFPLSGIDAALGIPLKSNRWPKRNYK